MTEEERSPRLLHKAAYTFPFPPTSQEQAFKPQAKTTDQYFTSLASLQGAHKQQ